MTEPMIIVLAHGIYGWGDEALGGNPFTKAYFYGIGPFLRQYCADKGIELAVVSPDVPTAASVEERGSVLKESIEKALSDRPAGTRAHIIAHSMGGLDARWVIAAGGLADKVASLTTLATPHRGTSVSRWALQMLDGLTSTANTLGAVLDRFRSLGERSEFDRHVLHNVQRCTREQLQRANAAMTQDGAAQFNHALATAEQAVRARTRKRVAYVSYGGACLPVLADVLHPLTLFRKLMRRSDPLNLFTASAGIIASLGTPDERHGGNDGAVSAWSAHFPWDDAGREYARTLPVDHVMFVNWRVEQDGGASSRMEAAVVSLYREIMDRIMRVEQVR